MARRTETVFAGQYFLAVQGMALIRTVLDDPPAAIPRVDEIRQIAAQFDEFPHSLAIPLIQHDIEDGYTQWAPVYDGPNPAIEGEQPIVHAMLAELPVGVALDAACGTGRHADKLSELGHHVIGVDTTDAMLDIAREKVPDADFRRGHLDDLPLDDASLIRSEERAQGAAAKAAARTVHLPGVGHWWMLQDPEKGAAMLEEFWASLTA